VVRNRETAIAIGVTALAVGCMAIDHLVGTESEAGESDSFPVDLPAFVIGSLVAVGLAAVLFVWLVRSAVRDEPDRAVPKAIASSALAVLTLPLVFVAVPFPVAGAGIALGLHARAGGRKRLAGAAVGVGALVLALAGAAYVVALATR
jgi:hypothetical protein